MKSYRCLFLIMFVFLPFVLFSQILVPGDIDIFINGFPTLEETIDILIDENDEMDSYFDQIEEFAAYIGHIIDTAIDDGKTITDDEFNVLKIEYQKILQINPPKELNDTFIKLGWDNDGHKKFMTIIFGLGLLFIQEGYELTEVKALLDIFDENDMAIIKDRIHELYEL